MSTRNSPDDIQALLEVFGPNAGLVEELFQEYLRNPGNVSTSWQEYFSTIAPAKPNGHREESTPAPPKPAPAPQDTAGTALKGVAAKIVENMEASLTLPTATSIRTMPVKVMEENRRLLNQHLSVRQGGKISFTHIISWAIVRALHDFPNMNAAFARIQGIPHRTDHPAINIGLAIDLTRKDGTHSLVVPNVKDAGRMNFAEFVAAYDTIVSRARRSSLEPSDFQGTSITLTNPGTVGTNSSIPRLMPGQGAIIATGAINYPAEAMGMSPENLSALGMSKVMTMTSTYDHRVIQGAESGQFLARIERLLLGEDRFYDSLFADLRIPYEPVRWSKDHAQTAGTMQLREPAGKQAKIMQLINAYRVRGHLIAHLDPLVNEPHNHPELDPANYDLTVWDLDREFLTGGLGGRDSASLREILDILRETYCGTTGVEYMNIQHPEQKRWLQDKMEPSRNRDTPPVAHRINALRALTAAEGLEKFLHTKFIGHKRFSLEGAETLIPILETLLTEGASEGIQEIVIGMAHRGRLNVLANTIGKSVAKIFSEFEGYVDPSTIQGSGDVKYHLGASGRRRTPDGKDIAVTVAPNPSHLEAVNPVVEGIVRAKQDRKGDGANKTIIPVLIHGDAAFAGQGIIAETFNLSQLAGYRTGGTIHVIINNQIGFTTSPDDARSTPYCTDVAKMVQAPIFHVNGDDVDAALRVARLALEYRQAFKKDVVIDMFCYRRHGHNEGDEPSYTQPLLYKKIRQHPSVRQIYLDTLLREHVLTGDEAGKISAESHKRYEEAFASAQKRELHFTPEVPLAVSPEEVAAIQPTHGTAIDRGLLEEITRALGSAPGDFSVHPKLVRMLDERRSLLEQDAKIDWAFAEALAFGSLLCDGTPVRLSGQDSSRGTFSQRHLVLFDAQTGQEYIPLNSIRQSQAMLSVYDSLLSEAAVLGFEFGYSTADPLALVLWEAQFGDFANGAQVIIDQFIGGSEAKWQEPCDLVLLLPHGYEGQGPEHSSARLERFLQLCAEDNMQVCNCTTPAQYFHLLRRQMRDGRRKPLIIMTPKSLLRYPKAVSRVADITDGRFFEVLGETPRPSSVQRVVLCSGKMYYDLVAGRDAGQLTPIVRVEQLYPFPEAPLRELLSAYSGASTIIWAQEEPKNMGAWTFMEPRLRGLLSAGQTLRYAGRKASASTATGSMKIHQEEQSAIVTSALTG